MSRELRQLLASLSAKQAEAKALNNKEDATPDELNSKLGEIKALQAKIEIQKALDEGKEFSPDGIELTGTAAKDQKQKKDEVNATYKSAFMNALRKKATNEDFKMLNSLNPNVDSDGGLIVPKDIQTQINEYKRSLPMLENLINIVPVGTSSGSRVYEKVETMTPLANITDLSADIEDAGSPKFENITYAIKDYAGIMPIPNDLLDDTDENLMSYLIQWISRKSVVTRNSLITEILTGLTPKAITDWKGIKQALNVTLDPIFSASASIITNQDGYQYLDTLVDGQKRPLLQPDAQKPGSNVLFGKPITVVSNVTLPTTDKKAPIFIGNAKEAITMFERQGHQVAVTNVGGTAFTKNRTEVRVVERENVKAIDTKAVVYGQINVTPVV